MPLKRDLLTKGYLPENMPPCFQTETIGGRLSRRSGWLSDGRHPVRAAPVNASKRGMARREFSFVHPSTAHDLAQFISVREDELNEFFRGSPFSLSRPVPTPDGDRAVSISSHAELEAARLERLSRFRFIARTDISRFYHSIYTHSLPWALHGKSIAKRDRLPSSTVVYMNRLDLITRAGQDGQTIGIPVGPDMSRYLAEVIGTGIDQEFIDRGGSEDCEVIRHVDDVWIGANTHAEAETALWRYREAIRYFELDINDNKTAIFSDNFNFSDTWPSEIAMKIEFAIGAPARRVPELLRAALEHAFSLAARTGDDGVLKYTLRYIDRNNLAALHWSVVEPFLKRAAAHFGHTIDYVARMIVWRHLAFEDLEVESWSPILVAILDRHGRLGNDGEVSWALYAILRLDVTVPLETARHVIENCGPTTVIALLSCADNHLVDPACFNFARELLTGEDADGANWPLILEWKVRQWTRHRSVQSDNALIDDLITAGTTIFDADRLPSVFQDVDESEFGTVTHAIEARSSMYDDNEDEEDGVPF